MGIVYFVNEGIKVEVPDGSTVYSAAKSSGVYIDAPCGGHGTCGKCTVMLRSHGSGDSFKPVSACRTVISGDTDVVTQNKGIGGLRIEKGRSDGLRSSSPVSDGYMVAFDIGTTTIVGYLLLGSTGEVLGSEGRVNPQTAFGADVISRLEHANKSGPDQLTSSVRAELNSIIASLCASGGISSDKISAVSVVGNTCMHHLFLGLPTKSLATIPYSPFSKDRMVLSAADYGLCVNAGAVLHVLPVMAGFVGADTVACLLSCSWTEREELSLMIDIGTNGEIVLGNRERFAVCSTAAGPALEGAKISCGMRGADGAIDHVRIENGKPVCHVIGEGEARGICGSGLIDLAAVLLELEIIDESGRLETPEYHLEGTGLAITRRDIRELQLAKGAICAGIRLLAEHMEVSLHDIKRIEIAGAFGSRMDEKSACAIGLIPEELSGRIRSVGNAAGEGACLALLSRENLINADILARKAEFVELGSSKKFQDVFVESLLF